MMITFDDDDFDWTENLDDVDDDKKIKAIIKSNIIEKIYFKNKFQRKTWFW